jgi:copper chaperone
MADFMAVGNGNRIREEKMEKVKIQGMSCQHCVMAVTKALNKIGGLKEVKVDLEKGEASFVNEGQISREKIGQAIVEAGFKVSS